ncbi:MAG: MotA/TolQ/ExbB proton channel family protein [Bdellovibrionales bacterium]
MNSAALPLWIEATQWASRSILVLLIGLSIWSVATMIRCRRLLATAAGDENRFQNLRTLIQDGKISEILQGPEAGLYESVVRTAAKNTSQEPSRIDRAVKSILALRRIEIEQSLTILATLGANAPFIGLFGTVLGIIQAFGALGSSQSGGSSVMVAISEALVATAIGLFVAIPAVVAFNMLSRKLRVLLTNCEALRDLYISRLKAE